MKPPTSPRLQGGLLHAQLQQQQQNQFSTPVTRILISLVTKVSQSENRRSRTLPSNSKHRLLQSTYNYNIVIRIHIQPKNYDYDYGADCDYIFAVGWYCCQCRYDGQQVIHYHYYSANFSKKNIKKIIKPKS